MSDDLGSRLRRNHEALLGPDYFLAATRIESLEADNEKLRAELDVSNANHRQMATTMADLARKHDALRARVREVVRPFAEFITDLDTEPGAYPWRDEQSMLRGLKIGSFRAAHQLMEEVK